jgi:uncharacterized protein YbjT (DUF2867 family)
MKVILFGATGMVGQGVLRACLLDPDVERVLAIGRTASGKEDAKLRDVVHANVGDLSEIESELSGYDACFFCLGVSSAGMSEADYRRVTYDLTLGAAKTLAKLNPEMTFIYVSGAGTDSTERGRSMWARVKGQTENALLQLPFKVKLMFRPGFIQPLHGIASRTALYRFLYAVMGPLYPVLKAVFPKMVTTTDAVGRAMLKAAKDGASKAILESDDINRLAETA